MKAAAAARAFWAAYRRRSGERVGASAPDSRITARVSLLAMSALAAAMIACAVVGFAVTKHNDRRLETERYAALRHALDEFHAMFGDVTGLDDSQLRFIERRAGLKDLRFESDLAGPTGREVQSLHDANGRIAGWFTWVPDRAPVVSLYWLWGAVGVAGLAFLVCAALAARAMQRLARSIEGPRKPAGGDALLRELENAIACEALDVHYQPIFAADGSGLIGVEALLRWTHPTRGAIAPAIFIPLAEQNGLMLELGEFVLRRALADAARWPDLSVAVNLSPVQIRDPKVVDVIQAIIAGSGLAASRIVLEVTEGVLIEDPREAQMRLEALRALGVRIALDDFGTGYSSLSYLQKFPFQLLKIDRAFVASLGTAGNAGAIIQSIVTLGHALGMKVLAEGVETDEQRVLLRLAGCDEMQGFLLAKPRPAEAIDEALLRALSGRAAAR
jgi:EAL domain-containing protein (putative c-di-GMP-specific phosphodiesterase class I)